MTPQKKHLTKPHAPEMEARQMPGRSDLLEAADSAPEQKNTTRTSPTLSLHTVSPCSWRILELEHREAREIWMHPKTQMRTNRLVQRGKVPPGRKPLVKLWLLLMK